MGLRAASTTNAENTVYPHANFYLLSYTKVYTKWVKHLNVRVIIMQILQENIRINLHDFGFG